MPTKILTQAEVNAGIAGLADELKNSQAKIHQFLLSTLDHTRQFGDYTGLVRVMNALPRGVRQQAAAHWVRTFSNKKLSLKRDDKTGVWAGQLAKDRSVEDFDIEGADATTFADLSDEKAISKPLDLAKLVAALKRFTNNDKTLADGTPQVPPEVVSAAQRALAAIAA